MAAGGTHFGGVIEDPDFGSLVSNKVEALQKKASDAQGIYIYTYFY